MKTVFILSVSSDIGRNIINTALRYKVKVLRSLCKEYNELIDMDEFWPVNILVRNDTEFDIQTILRSFLVSWHGQVYLKVSKGVMDFELFREISGLCLITKLNLLYAPPTLG